MAGDLKRPFQTFVGLVEAISQVRHVVAFEDEADILTFIEARDDDVCRSIFRAEDEVRRRFQQPEIDFHIIFLEGRPLDQFVTPLPPLVFSRGS